MNQLAPKTPISSSHLFDSFHHFPFYTAAVATFFLHRIFSMQTSLFGRRSPKKTIKKSRMHVPGWLTKQRPYIPKKKKAYKNNFSANWAKIW